MCKMRLQLHNTSWIIIQLLDQLCKALRLKEKAGQYDKKICFEIVKNKIYFG